MIQITRRVLLEGWRPSTAGAAWDTYRANIGMSLVGIFLVVQSGMAQVTEPPLPAARLTVRPHALVARPIQVAPGIYPLDSLSDGYPAGGLVGSNSITYDLFRDFTRNDIYVPLACTGHERRCPLVVSLFSDYNHPSIMEWQREMARRYRMIVLSLNVLKPFAQREPNPQDRYPRYLEVMRDLDVARLDAALRHVLPKFPIDPDRIALFSQAMGEAFHVGRNNTDIFSRIAERDGYLSVWTKTMAESSARNPEALFFVLGQPGEFHMSLPAVQGLRNDGYTVTVGLTRREHGHRMEDYDVIYRWFRDSWAAPAMAAPVSEPVPLLTAGAIAASAAFWAGFAREPDSVRQSHRKDLTVLVGSEPMPVRVTDLTAVAAEYPSVSRALRAVGLTAPEAESYWRAIIGVAAVWKANRQRPVVAVEAGSAVARNIALLNARPDEFAILRRF